MCFFFGYDEIEKFSLKKFSAAPRKKNVYSVKRGLKCFFLVARGESAEERGDVPSIDLISVSALYRKKRSRKKITGVDSRVSCEFARECVRTNEPKFSCLGERELRVYSRGLNAKQEEGAEAKITPECIFGR